MATAVGEWVLRFDQGTVLLMAPEAREEASLPEAVATPAALVRDERVLAWRAPAFHYRALVEAYRVARIPLRDEARSWDPLERSFRDPREPWPHQAEALAAWEAGRRRGTVVLPTGAGKTFVALGAIARCDRPTLVVTPTLELVNQWAGELERAFGGPVGILGGGRSQIEALTVTTYDSAWRRMESLGQRFALIVYDEAHHLPGARYRFAAEGALAPYRLALSATPEAPDGGVAALEALAGPVVVRRSVRELSGEVLSPYETRQVPVALSPEELSAYTSARETYLEFVRAHGIRFDHRGAWGRFLALAATSPDGRAAYRGWRDQRSIAMTASGKLHALDEILERHAQDRCLVFASDRKTVHAISERCLAACITHETPMAERRHWLEAFASGEIGVLVTAKVLNEGVDVPAANVGVVLSGSSSVREHVQRLGRLLRRVEGKRAIVYELVTAATSEEATSERRRQHDAWS